MTALNFPGVSIGVAYRPIGLTAVFGDSRKAQVHLDGSFRNISGSNHYGWANARSGHRLTMAGNFGVSGNRTDQYFARLSAVIASGAGHCDMIGGTNDIAQAATGYTTVNTIGPNQGAAVTAANVALVVFQNLQFAALQMLAAGFQVISIDLDPGSENFTAAMIGNLIELNQRLREFGESNPRILIFDLPKSLWNPTNSTTQLRFKTGYAQEVSGQGTHESDLGAYMAGIDRAAFLTSVFPPVTYLTRNIIETPSTNSLLNLLANPLMTGSGGTAGAGASGTIPASWTAARSGGGGTQAVVVSVGTPADGSPGSEAILACTFGAAGDIIVLKQDASMANVSIGDIVQGTCGIVIDAGSSAVSGVACHAQNSDGVSISLDTFDLLPLNNVAISNDGCSLSLKTEKLTVAEKGGSSYLTMRIEVTGAAAGTCTVRVRQAQLKKRFS